MNWVRNCFCTCLVFVKYPIRYFHSAVGCRSGTKKGSVTQEEGKHEMKKGIG